MKKFFILITLVIMCSILSFSATNSYPENFSVLLEKDSQFPEFTLYTLEGKEISSKNILNKNKKTIIVAATEWCPDCHEELPILEDFYQKNKSKYNFVVIFIEKRSSVEKVKEFMKKNNFTFPVYYDYNSSFSEGVQIKFIPTNIFLDKSGKISDVFVGIIDDVASFKNYLK